MQAQFQNGLRVTDAPTMEIAEMVLNKLNKSLVQKIEQLGVLAAGISGKDGGLLKVQKNTALGRYWLCGGNKRSATQNTA